MNIHFILTGGVIGPCEQRAILSAKIHGKQIILWFTGDKPDTGGLDVQVEYIEIPSWLTPEHKAHVFDVLGYQIAYEHGGLILGLDTISVRPVWDLMTTQDVVVSTDWPENDPNVLTSADVLPYRYNNNFLAKKGSDGARALHEEAKRRIIHEEEKWCYVGPLMLADFVSDHGPITAAPFPALCGWAPGYLWRFFLGLETPGPNVRVIHLCRIMYRSLYERRYQDFARDNPYYAGEVERRTDANERLLRCP